jgi:flagellar basal body-associated protein FliL
MSKSIDCLESTIDEIYLGAKLSEIQRLTLEHSEQLNQQQQQFDALATGFLDIVDALKQLQKDSSVSDITAISQNLDILGKATVNIYKKIDKNDVNRRLTSLESEQQKLCKTLEATQKSLQNQSENLTDYLDWKRAAVIIVITAIISSFSSLAIAYLVVSNQSDKKDQNPTQIEKPLNAKTKKTPKSK